MFTSRLAFTLLMLALCGCPPKMSHPPKASYDHGDGASP
jgi:hypothetical protein